MNTAGLLQVTCWSNLLFRLKRCAGCIEAFEANMEIVLKHLNQLTKFSKTFWVWEWDRYNCQSDKDWNARNTRETIIWNPTRRVFHICANGDWDGNSRDIQHDNTETDPSLEDDDDKFDEEEQVKKKTKQWRW